MKTEDALKHVAHALETQNLYFVGEEFADAYDVREIVAQALHDVASLLSVEETTEADWESEGGQQ